MKKDHPDLSLRRQCRLLSLARSTLYYQPRGERTENLKLMETIDRQFLETPWYGSRQPLGRLLCNRLPANEWPATCSGRATDVGDIVCGG